METKVTTWKWTTMADQKGQENPSELRRMYVRADDKFVIRLKTAAAMRGVDLAQFLREAAEIHICGIFAANGGNLGIQLESND
jgi:hypothetical protein